MGHIVKGLSSADIANIPSSVLQNNLHVFAESSLSVDQALAVAQKVAGAKRKRRSLGKYTGVSQLLTFARG